MLKRKFTLILLLFLSSCGYEALYSKRNSINQDFSISKISFAGERNINLKIKEKLNNYTTEEKDKNFILKISSGIEKIILAKNTSGDPTIFRNTIKVDVEVLGEDNFQDNLQIVEYFNYNNINNKFDLKKYEREILNNLSETVANKLIFKLSNIQ